MKSIQLVIVFSIFFVIYSRPAISDCSPDPSDFVEGGYSTAVTCTGIDTDGGYWTGAYSSFLYILEGAFVENYISFGSYYGVGYGNEVYNLGTIQLLDVGADGYIENWGTALGLRGGFFSTVINETTGVVTGEFAGIRVADESDVINRGSIDTTGNHTAGIGVGNYSYGFNDTSGVITISGIDSWGIGSLAAILNDPIEADRGVHLRNAGQIMMLGDISSGMGVYGDAIMENEGIINATGNDSSGIELVGRAGQIENTGSINATGIGNVGIEATYIPLGDSFLTDLSITNNGSVFTEGFLSEGITTVGYDGANIVNTGNVEVNGIDAQGITVAGTATTIQNTSTASVIANGTGVYGIALDGSGKITNDGDVTVDGISSVGIAAQNTGPTDVISIINTGAILATQGNSGGIGLLGSGSITSSGTIRMEGDASAGIYNEAPSGSIVPITNNGTITTTGAESVGVYQLGDEGSVTNGGSILVQGLLSYGVNIEGDDAEIFNTEIGVIATHEVQSVAINVVGERVNITNDGAIETQSSVSPGIAVQGNGCRGTAETCEITNTNGIVTNNDFSPAIAVIGSNHTVTNTGDIQTGNFAIGIGHESYAMAVVSGSNAEVKQQGINASIITAGDRSHGIVMGLDEGLQPNLLGAMESSSLTVEGGIQTKGVGAYAINVYGDENTINLNESSSLLTTGDASHGVRVRSTGTGTTKITNIGTVAVGARIDIRGNDADGIHVWSDDKVEILNQEGALISVEGSRSAAINIESSVQASIINEGQLNAKGLNAEDNYGIKAQFTNVAAPNSRTVNNLGQINVAGLGAHGIDVTGDEVEINNGDISPTAASIIAGDEFSIASTGIVVTGINNSVTNEKSITVAGLSATGIDVIAPSSGDFLITSAGTITVNSDGGRGMAFRSSTASPIVAGQGAASNTTCVVLGDTRADFINCGSIEMIDSDAATGMFASGINNTTIENQSAIAGNATIGGLRGISIESSNDNHISNLDQITLLGDSSIGVSVNGNSNTIINGTGDVAFPNIALDNPKNYADPLGNQLYRDGGLFESISSEYSRALPDGDQIPQGDILVIGANSIGISVEGNNNRIGIPTYFDKLATVHAQGVGSVGIRLSGNENLIVNGGDVRGDAIGIQGGNGNDSIVNLGRISGGVQLGAGDDVMVVSNNDIIGAVDGGSQIEKDTLVVFVDPDEFGFMEISGSQYVNFEQLYKTGSGALRVKDTLSVNDVNIEQGKIELLTGAVLQVDTTTLVIEPDGTLSGTGTVDGRVAINGGTIAPGSDGVGTLSITDNLDMSSGLLQFDAISMLSMDQLIVDGDVTLSGGLIEVMLDFSPESGSVLDLFTIQGGLNVLDGFGGIYGVAAAGSGLELGTEFTVSLGGDLYQGLVTSTVPVPPSLWLFGSGLIGLIAVARQKNV